MPLYEYRCKQCGHQFEKIQSFSAPEEKECPVCKGEVERLISAPAFQFKGAGWYVNDYAGKGSSKKAEESGGSTEKPAAASSDGAAKSTSDSGSSSGNNSGSSSGSGTASSTAGKSE